ncbi:MAG: peptidase [Hyphomicrobiales bacterium]|nr:hypothetical protein [Rickettsiales bacterium]MCP5362319.1 peptidase [Hyphomicrobiales bacterium]
MIAPQIDWAFIRQEEGGQQLQGYVPSAQSGVTIASGVDLGQMHTNDLRQLPLPEPLLTRLLPYAGLEGDAAKTAIYTMPLTLTQQEATVLDEAMQTRETERVVTRYQVLKSADMPDFSALPASVQTVVMSLAWHLGVNIAYHSPRFWRTLLRQDWQAMYHELRHFGTQHRYPARRRREARLLEPLLTNAG